MESPERIWMNGYSGQKGFRCFSTEPDMSPENHNVEYVRSDIAIKELAKAWAAAEAPHLPEELVEEAKAVVKALRGSWGQPAVGVLEDILTAIGEKE